MSNCCVDGVWDNWILDNFCDSLQIAATALLKCHQTYLVAELSFTILSPLLNDYN